MIGDQVQLKLTGEEQAWNVLANMNASGHEILTADKLTALHAAVDAKCANAQGYIADPRTRTAVPAVLVLVLFGHYWADPSGRPGQ